MSQYQPINQSPELPDVENPIMDLLIKDEKLQAAADNAFETMRGMNAGYEPQIFEPGGDRPGL